jgi:hypothetical protein
MPGTPELLDDLDLIEEWDMGPASSPPDIVDLMVQWFFQNFEDPCQNTPYCEGYVYIHGGPHYSADEIGDAFGDVATPEALEKAVAEIEKEGGPEWAPTHNRMMRVK